MPLKLRPKELLDNVRPSRVADMLLVKLAMPLVKLLRVARTTGGAERKEKKGKKHGERLHRRRGATPASVKGRPDES